MTAASPLPTSIHSEVESRTGGPNHRLCEQCDQEFTQLWFGQRYCCQPCRKAAMKESLRARQEQDWYEWLYFVMKEVLAELDMVIKPDKGGGTKGPGTRPGYQIIGVITRRI